jgi:hypothetical protein
MGGAPVSGVGLLGVDVAAVLPGIEGSNLAGEFRDFLAQCCVLRGLTNVGKRRLDSNLGDAVRAEGCSIKVGLILAGEEALNVVWQQAGPDAMKDVFGHVWC